MNPEQRILVIQTAFLGDLILMTPLLKRLRLLYPQHRLHVVTRSGLSEILISSQLADHVHEVKKGSRASYAQLLKHFRQTTQPHGFDLILCVHESPRSQLFARRIPAQRRIAFQNWWNFFLFQDRVKKPHLKPEALRQLSILSPLDFELLPKIQSYPDAGAPPFLTIPEWASLSIRERVPDLSKRFVTQRGSLSGAIALFPGSVWATKQWTESGFIEVASFWRKQNRRVLILGSPQERELCQRIAQASHSECWAGEFSLWELLSILKSIALVVSNDSGSAHLASLVHTPTVVLFGPTVLQFGYRPWQDRIKTVENNDLSCRPCGSHGPQKCPLTHHRCMKDIQAQEVIQAAQSLLDNEKPKRL